MEIDYNALGQSIDTTWGRSSTTNIATHSVKFSLSGNILTAKFITHLVFTSEKDMILTRRAMNEESDEYINLCLKSVKEKYKSITGKSLKTKEMNSTNSVEFIGLNPHNPKRTAYYRKFVNFDIG